MFAGQSVDNGGDHEQVSLQGQGACKVAESMLTRQVGLDRTQDTNTWVWTGHRHMAHGPGLVSEYFVFNSLT